MSDGTTILTIVGMVAITIVTRSFFFISDRPWRLPAWAERGLPYAPIAALAAVIAPEIFLSDGHLPTTWQDARWFALLAALGWYRWRAGVLGTMLAGLAVYLPLHIGAGW